MKNTLTHLLFLLPYLAFAQFAPPAGQSGSTAIFKDSSIIKAWATACVIERGLMQINKPDSGYASVGDEFSAIGKAGENGVVSLGDGGKATLTFASPISNGLGADFCIFENSFSDDFLELGFVEVSSNGIDFVRFPATSLTQDTTPVGSFGSLNATLLNNLAGKYRGQYGVPFDLEELKDSTQIDIQNITHVRIVDVVGSLEDGLARFDQFGNKINDPWPTSFPSSGFDLDAVGVIHTTVSTVAQLDVDLLQLYPNPAINQLQINSTQTINNVYVRSLQGQLIEQWSANEQTFTLNTSQLLPGIYLLAVETAANTIAYKRFVKQ